MASTSTTGHQPQEGAHHQCPAQLLDRATSRQTTILLPPGHGESVRWAQGDDMRIKASAEQTAGTLAVVEYTMPAGTPAPPLHVHPGTDEAWYILDGELTMDLGREQVAIAARRVRVRARRCSAHVLEPGTRRASLSADLHAWRIRGLLPGDGDPDRRRTAGLPGDPGSRGELWRVPCPGDGGLIDVAVRSGCTGAGLRKSYAATEAVRGIDLQVRRGEIFAFLGPNGAGKTTTVEILEGFRPRSTARCRYSGSIRAPPAARGATGSASCCRTPPPSRG